MQRGSALDEAPSAHADSGNITIAAAAVTAAIAGLLLALIYLLRPVFWAHEAQVTAEIAAVATAHSHATGGSNACDLASEVAARNGHELRSCRIFGDDAVVAIKVGTEVITARAGP